jgi:translation elongation factor EF-Tu-like GTPase
MSAVPRLEAEIAFLAPEEGGRRQLPAPPWLYPSYMPHLTVGEGDHLGVRFVDGPASKPGVRARFVLEMMYHPVVCYDPLQPGVEFAVREGNRIVAVGRVLGRLEAV